MRFITLKPLDTGSDLVTHGQFLCKEISDANIQIWVARAKKVAFLGGLLTIWGFCRQGGRYCKNWRMQYCAELNSIPPAPKFMSKYSYGCWNLFHSGDNHCEFGAILDDLFMPKACTGSWQKLWQITWSRLLTQILILNAKQCWSSWLLRTSWSGSTCTLFAKTEHIGLSRN